ncbi:NAD-dependent epimerase/dehydratase family protein [Candidatus Nitrosotenuis cloacae]|uniref:NAD-dependent epimerase/dehydratase family protein n=1 Tax=Candidatus Nitrosotenuis cloacae TaxID=1603555 RepID=UPI002282ACCE|nr:NAD-dependent epimerase/dehydratase family protein [Candidatus Nitrosotenuis cloacae]
MRAHKALVTGGAGFIGSHIVEELLRRNIETVVIDDLSTGSLANLSAHHNNKLLHIKIGNAKRISEILRDIDEIDVVFHEAAIASVPRSVIEPMVVHDTNVNMTLEIMNFCLQKNIKRFIFASSAAVYGVLHSRAEENIVCSPFSPYGASKLCVENYLDAYYHTYGLENVNLRYFNVYGPRQKLNDYSGVITVFINNILGGQTPTIHGDGLQERDFVSVADIVRANMLSMDSDAAIGNTYNVASGQSTSIKRLLETLQDITKTTHLGHRFGPRRAGDVKFGLASAEKIRKQLGFEITVPLRQGLNEVIEFMKMHAGPQLASP